MKQKHFKPYNVFRVGRAIITFIGEVLICKELRNIIYTIAVKILMKLFAFYSEVSHSTNETATKVLMLHYKFY